MFNVKIGKQTFQLENKQTILSLIPKDEAATKVLPSPLQAVSSMTWAYIWALLLNTDKRGFCEVPLIFPLTALLILILLDILSTMTIQFKLFGTRRLAGFSTDILSFEFNTLAFIRFRLAERTNLCTYLA